MPRINEHFLKLEAGYLFPEIARREKAFSEENPELAQKVIRCGIGDVTEPLPTAVREAIKAAVDEMGQAASFRGYGPSPGYDFLRERIASEVYAGLGIEAQDIFVSDGSKCDSANLLDIFGSDNRIAIMNPVYPVYVDTNVMAGHSGPARGNGLYEGLHALPCRPENDFVPALPEEPMDLIYLCYPNNPTGAVAAREQLQQWVDYARKHQAVILYDAAYEAFIQEEGIPHSIYEIEGARQCAIELRSFSKNAGFTGLRCGYVVVPAELQGQTGQGQDISLQSLWSRRQATKFNGVSYPVQRAAEAVFSPEGQAEIGRLIAHYMGNAALLLEAVQKLGWESWGGKNAPYLWVRTPEGVGSWEMFQRMLHEAQVVVTPGAGFGSEGEGFFRISAFNSRAKVEEVCQRLQRAFG